MFKIFIEIKPGVDKLDVFMNKYSCDNGKLVESFFFSSVKQIKLMVKEVTISKQLSSEPFVLIVDSMKPLVEFKDNGILIVREGG